MAGHRAIRDLSYAIDHYAAHATRLVAAPYATCDGALVSPHGEVHNHWVMVGTNIRAYLTVDHLELARHQTMVDGN